MITCWTPGVILDMCIQCWTVFAGFCHCDQVFKHETKKQTSGCGWWSMIGRGGGETKSVGYSVIWSWGQWWSRKTSGKRRCLSSWWRTDPGRAGHRKFQKRGNRKGLGGSKRDALENQRSFGLGCVVLTEEWHFSFVSHSASPLSQLVAFPLRLFRWGRTVGGWIQAVCTEDLTHQAPLEN